MRTEHGALGFEMRPYEIAHSLVEWSKQEDPRNDWLSVRIARRHLAALLAEIHRLSTHDHEPVEGCPGCAEAEAMRRV